MADILPEKWMKVLTVTATALAVVASIAGSRASSYIGNSQLLEALEADQWSYFQAKSIKQDLFQLQDDRLHLALLGATVPAQRYILEKAIRDSSQDISRYDQEKADIKKKADQMDSQNAVAIRRSAWFSSAVVFAQIAIMMAAVAVLLNLRRLWGLGVGLGLISIFFIARGFFL